MKALQAHALYNAQQRNHSSKLLAKLTVLKCRGQQGVQRVNILMEILALHFAPISLQQTHLTHICLSGACVYRQLPCEWHVLNGSHVAYQLEEWRQGSANTAA